MNIAVYSGSFDPLHVGHLAIMEYLTREDGFDWVYLVVSPQSPFKEAQRVLSAQQRYEAAIKAALRHPNLHVWVEDIELHLPKPSYTINTLDALKEREPQNSFTLIIGADNLAVFRGWKDYKRILTEYGVAVYPRDGVNLSEVKESLLKECSDYKIQVVDAPKVNISSSQIRAAVAEGKDMSEFLM